MRSMALNFSMVIVLVMGVFGLAMATVVSPVVPAAAAAPVLAYARAVPYNVPPFASRVDINTRNIAAPILPAAAYSAAVPAIVPGPLISGPTYAGGLPAPLGHYAAAYGPTPVFG